MSSASELILAPLRGVTVRCFRETFADVIREAGFAEAVTPFIPATAGVDPLKDRELRPSARPGASAGDRLRVTPQFIGKDPEALRQCLVRVKAAGYETADLNGGCPFPLVRNKGRGSGLLRTPDVLRRMLEVGCEVMGPGRFSLKVRLGIERNDELLGLMPLINGFPLRFLTVHARNARQMYEGPCDLAAAAAVEQAARMPVVRNGDLPFPAGPASRPLMIGRSFVRHLGGRADVRELVERYVDASQAELCGVRPVLGRLKELIAYWKDLPAWRRQWPVIKVCRSVEELRAALPY
ncbi:MAG: tRNA-dihydrouridine synthase family protein [Kiritimatiellia bacterium]